MAALNTALTEACAAVVQWPPLIPLLIKLYFSYIFFGDHPQTFKICTSDHLEDLTPRAEEDKFVDPIFMTPN